MHITSDFQVLYRTGIGGIWYDITDQIGDLMIDRGVIGRWEVMVCDCQVHDGPVVPAAGGDLQVHSTATPVLLFNGRVLDTVHVAGDVWVFAIVRDVAARAAQ